MTARRALLVIALVVASASVVVTLLPAQVPLLVADTEAPFTMRTRCGPPLSEAWHTEPGGWFGYAPLSKSSRLSAAPHVGCREPARRRLRASAAGFALSFLLVLGAFFIDPRPRLGWRPRRLRPAS